MRVSFLILAVLLLITGVAALTNHEQIIEKQLEIRKANVERINLPIVVSMDAARGYIQTLGQSTITLNELENSYKESITNIRDETTDTHLEMGELVDESKALVNAFKSELVSRLNSGGGNQARLTSIVAVRILENGPEINRLNEEFWDIRETNSMEVFDLQLIIGENFIDWFEENGYNTNELNAKKKEIYYMRVVLLQAIQSRDEAAIQNANDKITLLAKEWFEIGKRLLIEGPLFCTQDVFTCPDGSTVGRDPRNDCKFFACPIPEVILPPVRVCTQDVFTCPDGSTVGRDP
ncbi:MAG: hypothetical protein AABW49_03790, partial [Nanoarchaeota archaeon]